MARSREQGRKAKAKKAAPTPPPPPTKEEEATEEVTPAQNAGDKRKKETSDAPLAKQAKVGNGNAECQTVIMRGFADKTAAKEWLEKNYAAFNEVNYTRKACFGRMKSEDDVQKAINASDDQHRVERAKRKPRGAKPDKDNTPGDGLGGAIADGEDSRKNDSQTNIQSQY